MIAPGRAEPGQRRARAGRRRGAGHRGQPSGRRARWQTASATASASSESSAATPSSARAVRIIWSLPARPEPVKASFTSLGWYSKTGRPARAATASATPRAWPSTSAERGEMPAKICSMATSAGRVRAMTAPRPSRSSASRSAMGRSPGTSTPDSTTVSRPPSRATTP